VFLDKVTECINDGLSVDLIVLVSGPCESIWQGTPPEIVVQIEGSWYRPI